jgi:eukaryotic-like serine/threonine-protein kinase
MLEPETILQGRYLIMRRIGHGGMGAVYLAKDQRLGSLLALKETFFTDERMLKAFEREARLLASLRHPALPRVSDHFAEGAGQFLVMEYIAGDDLEQMLMRRGYAFAPADVLAWADQLLDALDYLHTQQPPIIHRDIKPQNLKLTDRGQIILLDFGLAKGAASGMTQATGSSSILGYTPGYAALEQIQGAGTDGRSDLYSLAATLYHLMSGATPAAALTRAMAVVNGERDPLELADGINPHIPAAVAAVLQRTLALKRDARPATASAMRQALREASAASSTAGAGDTSTVLRSPPLANSTASGYAQTLGAPADPRLIERPETRNAALHPEATNVAARLATQPMLAPPARRARRSLLIAAALIFFVGIAVAGWFIARSGERSRTAQSVAVLNGEPAAANPANNAKSPTNQGAAVSSPANRAATISDPAVRNAAIAAGEIPAEIHKSGGEMMQSAVKRVEPAYPPLAKVARISGSVVVQITVDEQGNVTHAQAMSGPPLLRNAAVSAAYGWKFAPDKVYGKPVKIIGTLTFNFNL